MVKKDVHRFEIWLSKQNSIYISGQKGLILLDQMSAVDKSRLRQKLGVISQSAKIKIINCLQELFAY